MFSRHVLYGLALLQAFVASSPLPLDTVPHYFQKNPFTRREVPVTQIAKELGAIISSHSAIYLPSNSSFADVTHRWNTLAPPDIQIAVQPAEESDISKIVKYCNQNSLEFLAVNRGHGFTTSLSKFKGVQIDLKLLKSMTIQSDKKSALFQAGSWAHEVIPALWDKGYVTATGSNECVGIAGPALGGGHGRLEGLYGLVSDNIVHLNVVLADGSTISVNETSNNDLLWAMKGAGHNFGIVTSFKLKIYPIQSKTWHYHNYYWTHDKLEAVLKELNKIQDNGKTPVLLGASYGQISLNETLNKKEATLWWTFAYGGPAADAEKILSPFNAIEALSQEIGDVSYPEIIFPQGTSNANCVAGSLAIATSLLKTYNITAQRQTVDLFNKNLALYPDLAKSSRLYLEGYATKGMQDIDAASTAYPHRDQNHLIFFTTTVPKGSNLLEPAKTWAKDTWDLWNAGQPGQKPAMYVNYATGNDYESLESIYGYDSWRLERLRGLKNKYDPHNRFRFYVPIISS
ncbi:FAD-binding domain-containing protein [Annulohypoxylon maeteangense]|uniref:FAD-binding domain-containing protein n=1 Tax=Annulohypoxylon maeteangense TaxID=1927788 RepID=UPI00200741DF|nr:FAD-binding domain-containing protein [Annulohypoxylon maeteangense]KAI0879960.1 FAD-binding domain-containing protein [Annulohypoxylon maeteangense]